MAPKKRAGKNKALPRKKRRQNLQKRKDHLQVQIEIGKNLQLTYVRLMPSSRSGVSEKKEKDSEN